jgi:hypothetical protein
LAAHPVWLAIACACYGPGLPTRSIATAAAHGTTLAIVTTTRT